MKIRHLVLAAAIVLLPAAAQAASKVGDFALADRIKAKVASGAPLDIYVSYHDVSNEFAPFMKAGVEKAGAEDKVNARFVGPVGANADGQISEIETLMGKMDGLAISSVSSDALAPVIDRVLAAGIPVVTFNTDNPGSKRLAFAGQDLVQSGREAGKLMAKVLDGKGKVLITTIDAAAQWSLDREKGAREALKDSPGIEVVNTLNTGTDPQKIYSEIENAMLANPSVTGVLSLECCSTPAAGTWVKRNGATGKVKVVGFDLLDQTVQLVEEGEIQATIDQAPEKQGFAAVDLLVKFLKGTPIDNVDTGVKVYAKDNIAEVAKK
ncbi:sugar ABC transporter substrate-binding protein [Labrys wisconsinensis]|uniref:Simple sugar transport system substrate-binding protein/ribose transport system substrate-binding protein n=1 Tax=Labrys wisconsinensis TaxID=425677 RepID=A0ABU0J8H5_9HYPH|nr:sugar ABC transporter substrate-binding protein [Labrys wisconsinensis]MDQ0469472.1 simple sugar transport system substrate-binding protein/ribose transport system substrate-binding protein [Labrys wisconsinensis]